MDTREQIVSRVMEKIRPLQSLEMDIVFNEAEGKVCDIDLSLAKAEYIERRNKIRAQMKEYIEENDFSIADFPGFNYVLWNKPGTHLLLSDPGVNAVTVPFGKRSDDAGLTAKLNGKMLSSSVN